MSKHKKQTQSNETLKATCTYNIKHHFWYKQNSVSFAQLGQMYRAVKCLSIGVTDRMWAFVCVSHHFRVSLIQRSRSAIPFFLNTRSTEYIYSNLVNRPTLEDNPTPFLNKVVAKGAFLSEVHSPIHVIVHEIMLSKKHQRSSTVHEVTLTNEGICCYCISKRMTKEPLQNHYVHT